MQNALYHATVEARRTCRIFLFQSLGRGAQFMVGTAIQFLLSLPHDLIGALQVRPGDEEFQRGVNRAVPTRDVERLSLRLEVLKIRQAFQVRSQIVDIQGFLEVTPPQVLDLIRFAESFKGFHHEVDMRGIVIVQRPSRLLEPVYRFAWSSALVSLSAISGAYAASIPLSRIAAIYSSTSPSISARSASRCPKW